MWTVGLTIKIKLCFRDGLCTYHRLHRGGGGGGPRADVETLLIVHFKVLVFPQPWGLFFLAKSPLFGEAKHPPGFEDALQNFIFVL